MFDRENKLDELLRRDASRVRTHCDEGQIERITSQLSLRGSDPPTETSLRSLGHAPLLGALAAAVLFVVVAVGWMGSAQPGSAEDSESVELISVAAFSSVPVPAQLAAWARTSSNALHAKLDAPLRRELRALSDDMTRALESLASLPETFARPFGLLL